MKHNLTLALLALLSFPVAAQDFLLLQDAGGNTVNGSTMIYYGSADATVLEIGASVTLVAGADRTVNLRRYELDVQPNTLNYFCWGLCYLEQEAGALPVWHSQSNHALDLTAGVAEVAFKAYHMPNGQLGNSTYRFVWFDVANSSDTVWVDIEFRATPVSIQENMGVTGSLAIHPNPSLGDNVQFTVELEGSHEGAMLLIHNTLGEQVHATSLQALRSRSVIPTADMASGLYFATVQRDGIALATKRFVITPGH